MDLRFLSENLHPLKVLLGRFRPWARAPFKIKFQDLTIRTLYPSDVQRVAKALYDPHHQNRWNVSSAKDCEKILYEILASHGENVAHPIVCFFKNEVVGICRFKRMDADHLTLEISGIWLCARFRNRVNSAKLKAGLLKYCFEKLKCERVEFRVKENNVEAQFELENLGLTMEGIMRSRLLDPDGSTWGCMIYSAIKEEWPEALKKSHDYLLKLAVQW